MNDQRSFEDQQAKRERVPLLVGLMGPSGGGKTYSALRIATGIQKVVGGEIFVVDTEGRRALHYADDFAFRHVEFRPPFGSLDYLAAIRYCVGRGAKVVVVDSMTHEHIGEGGYLESAEQVVTRIAGDDWKKREKAQWAGWAKVGPIRQRMIEGIKQLNANFVFCFRAKEKTKPVKGEGGKTEAVAMGFMPLAGEELLFEMTVNCLLLPKADGVPTWRSDHVGEKLMMKLPRYFRSIFEDNQPLSEDIGRRLAAWAAGGQVAPPASGEPGLADDYIEYVKEFVGETDDHLAIGTWWNSTEQKDQRKKLGLTQSQLETLQQLVRTRIETLKQQSAA